MFENRFVDAFSRVPWFVVPVVYLPLIALCLAQGWARQATVGAMVAQFALGVVVWTFLEYWAHRTVFHWIPDTSWGERFHFIAHGVHHTWDKDRYRLVMPPAASLTISAVLFAGFYGLGSAGAAWIHPSWVWALFAGVMAGYLFYDMAHYALHHLKPRGTLMKRLRAHHMNHHHNRPDRKFGVSNTLWDHVFGTY